MGIKPLKQAVLEYVLQAITACSGSRTKAARALNISVKSVRNYIQRLRDLGYNVPDPKGGYSDFNKKMLAKRQRKL